MSDVNTNIGVILEALNDKTDRDFNNMNPSATAKETIVGWGMPKYDAGVSKTSGSSAPSKGWAVAFGHNANVQMYVNGVQVAEGNWVYNSWSGNWNMQIMVDEGDVVSGENWTFFPCKGV